MSDFEGQLRQKLPLDRRALFSELKDGCNSKLLQFLVARFWVNEETDPNDDLGFVFALKPVSLPLTEADYFYKLYLSCVLPCATMRLYTLDASGNSSCATVAVNEAFWEQSAQLKQLRTTLLDSGYNLLWDRGDPLILQAKEATASVLEPYVAASRYGNHGERVVVGQRLMQAAPDIFLGWTHRPSGRDFYFRQLWDMKGSVDIAKLEPHGLDFYGALCARTLARGHARSGDAVAISAYLGASDAFDGAVADLAETYADVNARDHAAFLAAIERGAVSIPATDAAGRE
jgi:hypothetical protein